MTSIPVNAGQVEQLGRASRRAAFLSLGGFLIVLGAIAYAVVQLQTLERERMAAAREVASLQGEVQRYTTEVGQLRSDLAKVRGSLSAARAAIHAFHVGHFGEAVALYDEALAADPDNAYLQNLRAYSLFRLGRLDDAIESERRSVAADPNYGWGYLDLARFLCAQSPAKLDEAREAAQRAVALRPDLRSIMENDGEFQKLCRHKVP
jgi:tetratricopeptide (TPR) repeat protein